VPADGFNEWTKIEKHPHFFTVNGGAPFAIANIWDQGDDIPRCCLLTTSANTVLEPVHDRMPVIVWRRIGRNGFRPGAGSPELSAHYDPIRSRGDVGAGGVTAGKQRQSG
jgi:putative SOS response-associated peptidase YedK